MPNVTHLSMRLLKPMSAARDSFSMSIRRLGVQHAKSMRSFQPHDPQRRLHGTKYVEHGLNAGSRIFHDVAAAIPPLDRNTRVASSAYRFFPGTQRTSPPPFPSALWFT